MTKLARKINRTVNKKKEKKLGDNLTQMGKDLLSEVGSEQLSARPVYTVVNIPNFLYTFVEQLAQTYNLSIEEMVSNLASEGLSEGLKQRVNQVLQGQNAGEIPFQPLSLESMGLNTEGLKNNISKLNELSEKVISLTQTIEQTVK
jgi:hypothetical protein